MNYPQTIEDRLDPITCVAVKDHEVYVFGQNKRSTLFGIRESFHRIVRDNLTGEITETVIDGFSPLQFGLIPVTFGLSYFLSPFECMCIADFLRSIF
ncbi:MAG: hypothetical protein AABX04_08180 [Nanoarchaeota archaeon]